MKKLLLSAAVLFLLSAVSLAQVRGSYMETRSADVYTGQCFANGEVNLNGSEALMAWHIDSGAWEGVRLDGTTVAAAVRAKATLGDPYAEPYPAKSVVLIDDRSTPKQQKALLSFARRQAGRLLENVVRVERLPIVMEVPEGEHVHGRARFQAGDIAAIHTRGINGKDHLCGNEVTFYSPLTDVKHAMAAVALKDSYTGPGLGTTWTLEGKRSAFVGHFEAGAPQVARTHSH